MNTERTPRPARPGQWMRAFVAVVAFAIYSPPPASGEYPKYFFHVIGDVGTPGSVSTPAINASGEVVYRVNHGNQPGSPQTIYVGTVNTSTPIVDNAATFARLHSHATINDLGDVAFKGYHSGGRTSIVRYTAATQGMTTIAEGDEGDPLATFSSVTVGSINNGGGVAFGGVLTGSGLVVVAAGSGGAPAYVDILDPGWSFSQTSWSPRMNVAGPSLELLWETRADGLLGETTLIEKGSTFNHTTIAQGAELALTVLAVGGAAISNAGEVSFTAKLAGGAEAVYYGNGGAPTLVADTTGEFDSFYPATAISDAGVAFNASLDVAGGGVYTGPNVLTDKVLAEGDTVGTLTPTVYFVRVDPNGMNDRGQIAMMARFNDGTSRVIRADPPILLRILEGPLTVASFKADQSSAMSQIVPVSSGSEMLSFDYAFTTTSGQLVVTLGGEVLLRLDAPAAPASAFATREALVDFDLLFPDRPAEALLKFELLGTDGTAGLLLDNVQFGSLRNGGFGTGDLTGWQLAVMEGDGAGVAVDPFFAIPEPGVAVATIGGSVFLSLSDLADGVEYVLERSWDLSVDGWREVLRFTADGASRDWGEPLSGDRGFYRLRTAP